MSKYKDLIQKARKAENQIANEQENQIANEPKILKNDQPESQKTKEPEVNLCIKVPKPLRQHWAAEAKRQGSTLKAIIYQALEERLGLPE